MTGSSQETGNRLGAQSTDDNVGGRTRTGLLIADGH